MAKLLTLLNVLIMPKGYDFEFNEYLHSSEVQCKCSYSTCHFTLVGKATIEAFYSTRLEFGKVLRINSFFRCQKHGEAIGSVDHSSHSTGFAVDVSTRGFTGKEKERLIAIAKKYFDYVKVYDTFIHLQINPEEIEGGICG